MMACRTRHQCHVVLRPIQPFAFGSETQDSRVVKQNAFGEHVVNKVAGGFCYYPK
jgi:hypothetical protein